MSSKISYIRCAEMHAVRTTASEARQAWSTGFFAFDCILTSLKRKSSVLATPGWSQSTMPFWTMAFMLAFLTKSEAFFFFLSFKSRSSSNSIVRSRSAKDVSGASSTSSSRGSTMWNSSATSSSRRSIRAWGRETTGTPKSDICTTDGIQAGLLLSNLKQTCRVATSDSSTLENVTVTIWLPSVVSLEPTFAFLSLPIR